MLNLMLCLILNVILYNRLYIILNVMSYIKMLYGTLCLIVYKHVTSDYILYYVIMLNIVIYDLFNIMLQFLLYVMLFYSVCIIV